MSFRSRFKLERNSELVLPLRVAFIVTLSVLAVAGAAIVSLSPAAIAAERQEFEQRLKTVEMQVRKTEKDIAQLKQEYSALNTEKKSIEESLKRNQSEEKKITASLADYSRKKEILQRDYESALDVAKRKEARVRSRLRALYVTSVYSSYGEILFRSGGDEVERLAVYAKKLKKHDDALFAGLNKSIERLIASRLELENAEASESKARDELKAKRTELELGLSRSKTVVDEISSKRKAAERALLRLREEAAHLESLLEQLMKLETEQSIPPGEEVDGKKNAGIAMSGVPSVENPTVSVPAIATPAIHSKAVGRSADAPPVTLIGLFGKGVTLRAPVSARIVQPFGRGKGSSFSELVSSKGVDCAAPEGASVEALANGRVAFVGQMPGFGTVVILDHGQRHYSMYGRLGASSVAKGELVPARASLGTAGAINEKGRNFYLEVRKDGSPVNPEGVVKGFNR